jgi:hypothetical protein
VYSWPAWNWICALEEKAIDKVIYAAGSISSVALTAQGSASHLHEVWHQFITDYRAWKYRASDTNTNHKTWGHEYWDYCVLGWETLWTNRQRPTLSSPGYKKFSKPWSLSTTLKQCNIPEECGLNTRQHHPAP